MQADLHFHALPGIDDGPETVGDSLALIRAAALDGTTTVVATPHVRSDFVTAVDDLHERVGALRVRADEAGLRVRLLPGAELGHDMVGRLDQQELESIAQGPPGNRWLLVETPFEGMGPDFHTATSELRDRGFGIVIAHPERSADATLDHSAGLRRELTAGAVAQVNAQSLTGDHGPQARTAAFGLIGEGLVAIVGSDAHGPSRPPLLGQARAELLEGGIHAAVGRALTVSGPLGLLARGVCTAHQHRSDLLVA